VRFLNDPTRRDFMKLSAVGLAGALIPWRFGAPLADSAVAAGKTGEPAPTAGAAGADPGAATAAAALTLATARWSGEAPPEPDLGAMPGQLTEAAIEALGGMKRFVSPGYVVWIKPNIGWNRTPELAATTNPQVVATLVRLCLAAGAKAVKVGDNPCHPAKQSYASSGIAAAAEAAGAQVVFLDETRCREVALGGERLKSWPLFPEMLEADLLINVPIAKHHSLSEVTLAMKNYMGAVGGNRDLWHQDLPGCLRDITAYFKPRLTVLDAVRVLTRYGPTGGRPQDVRRLDTVAAATDIVALDAYGAELMGQRAAGLGTVRVPAEAGLGEMDWRKTAYKELAVS
jgi:uncharacterized protein (DUF362 family)